MMCSFTGVTAADGHDVRAPGLRTTPVGDDHDVAWLDDGIDCGMLPRRGERRAAEPAQPSVELQNRATSAARHDVLLFSRRLVTWTSMVRTAHPRRSAMTLFGSP